MGRGDTDPVLRDRDDEASATLPACGWGEDHDGAGARVSIPPRSRLRSFATGLAVLLGVGVIAVVSVAGVRLASIAPQTDGNVVRAVVPPAGDVPVPAGAPDAAAPDAGAAAPGVDPGWLSTVANTTGIPARALAAYATADLVVGREQPSCGIAWNTLAGIGSIESDHGRHDGSVLSADGYPVPAIRGIPLDGTQSEAIRDTDGGAWDGDTVWDRAVGPMQFIPDTWMRWGADGNGDGVADPNQIDDAALAAARYLCAAGAMTTPEGWRAAVFSYNRLDSYVNDVARTANEYAARAGG